MLLLYRMIPGIRHRALEVYYYYYYYSGFTLTVTILLGLHTCSCAFIRALPSQLRFYSGFAFAVALLLGLLNSWALRAIDSVDGACFLCRPVHMHRTFIFYSLDGQPIFASPVPHGAKIDHLNGLCPSLGIVG